MSEAIFTAETGLRAYEAGLLAISNDSANLNTPGFKGSSVLFADLIGGSNDNGAGPGNGVTTLGSTINFSAGQLQSDGNPLDLALSGNGFFTLRDGNGNIHYTQDGQFHFDNSGTLVSNITGESVMAFSSNGTLTPINISALQNSPAGATGTVTFGGNLLSTATTDTVSTVTVFDSAGNSDPLSLSLTAVTGQPGSWTATLSNGTTTVGTGTIQFSNGQAVSGHDQLSMTFTPPGGTAVPLTLDFSNVTSNNSGAASTLAVAHTDGHAAGTLSGETFDSTGTLILSYSNGQTAKGGQLALATFASPEDLAAISSNEFALTAGGTVQAGVAGAGAFGTVQAGEVEASNVDLSTEFSQLVVMQRGFQAASEVVSTASDMLSKLFGIITQAGG